VARYDDNLDPELAAGLEQFAALGFATRRFEGDAIPAFRRALHEQLLELQPDLAPNERIERLDQVAAAPAGEVPVRVYRPRDAAARLPCLLWIHGGGMIAGHIDMDDLMCDRFADEAGCVVVSVEYRLAPEHPHPAPVEDCFAALQWIAASADALGIDPARIAVGGSSAGGGLAAGTALLARDRGGPALCFQLLIYPMIDDRNSTPSALEFDDILSWSGQHNLSGWTALLGQERGGDNVSQYAAPARAGDLAGLPPAIIQVGELDVFRDEDIGYASGLLRAGVATELHVYPGAYHGFNMHVPEAAVSRRMTADTLAALRRALHPQSRAAASAVGS
jgi:acetyl esterase/lipase